MSNYTVNDVVDRVWNDSGDESAKESDEDYSDECESSEHDALLGNFFAYSVRPKF